MQPGALEIDLVEHNGGSSLGHFVYTLTVVDIVSGYSRRKAVLGKSQLVVLKALNEVLSELSFEPWGVHIDNGKLNSLWAARCSAVESNTGFNRSAQG